MTRTLIVKGFNKYIREQQIKVLLRKSYNFTRVTQRKCLKEYLLIILLYVDNSVKATDGSLNAFLDG